MCAVKLTTHPNIDQYKYSGYGIGFHRGSVYSFGNGFGRNVIIFGADMNLSIKIYNRKNDILIRGKGPTQGLDGNGADSYLFVNGTEIIKFKAK